MVGSWYGEKKVWFCKRGIESLAPTHMKVCCCKKFLWLVAPFHFFHVLIGVKGVFLEIGPCCTLIKVLQEPELFSKCNFLGIRGVVVIKNKIIIDLDPFAMDDKEKLWVFQSNSLKDLGWEPLQISWECSIRNSKVWLISSIQYSVKIGGVIFCSQICTRNLQQRDIGTSMKYQIRTASGVGT